MTVDILGRDDGPAEAAMAEAAMERALAWFHSVEECCTRFEPQSEVMRLVSRPGEAVCASAILFEAVQFALAVAEESGGAFDPTVGQAMERRGFNREYRSGKIVETAVGPGEAVSYRDVQLDPAQKTITLLRPLILDLGAVAKGMAIDLAARELAPLENFAIDAGGDLYLAGCNAAGEPWSVGIRHPRRANETIGTIRISGRAVCTSGDYESRVGSGPDGHHILDPRAGAAAQTAASVTVVAPTAMLADALSTAAFVLGPGEGIALFQRLGVEGLIVTPELERYATEGFPDAL